MPEMRVLLEYNHRQNYLDVRTGFLDKEFDGTVAKVIRKAEDNVEITVGLREDDFPVYVRIRDAQQYDEQFSEAARLRSRGIQPSPEILQHIGTTCIELMRDVALAYRRKKIKAETEKAQFTYQDAVA